MIPKDASIDQIISNGLTVPVEDATHNAQTISNAGKLGLAGGALVGVLAGGALATSAYDRFGRKR